MANTIVITTINPPTKAVRSFASLDGWRTIVVGDEKTPLDWQCQGVEFLPLGYQKKLPFKLSSALPLNHYSRKMIGYLVAAQTGCNIIAETDDDNHPKSNWNFPEFDAVYDEFRSGNGFINVYERFTEQKIWPRGYPLDLVLTPGESGCSQSQASVGVWQALADNEPDVDAIYRLVLNETCQFNSREPLVLAPGTVCPFNSQNTAFRRDLLPLMYLPATVTFRFTDILRSLVAQPIMWHSGYRLGFLEATVTQLRNPHDYMEDFASEVPMFLQTRRTVDIVKEVISAIRNIEDNLYAAYRALVYERIVEEAELSTLEAWLDDCSHLR